MKTRNRRAVLVADWEARVRRFCDEQAVSHNELTIQLLGTPAFVAVRDMFLAGAADRIVASELLRLAGEHGLR